MEGAEIKKIENPVIRMCVSGHERERRAGADTRTREWLKIARAYAIRIPVHARTHDGSALKYDDSKTRVSRRSCR